MISSYICIQKYSRYLIVDLLYQLQSKHSLTFVIVWIARLAAPPTIIFLAGAAKAGVPRLTSSAEISAELENQ